MPRLAVASKRDFPFFPGFFGLFFGGRDILGPLFPGVGGFFFEFLGRFPTTRQPPEHERPNEVRYNV